MKKLTVLIIISVLIIFLIPIIFVKRKSISVNNENKDKIEELEVEKYNYSDFSKIKLLHNKTNQVEEVNLDEYIANVVSAEMPVKYEIEALKAQAVVARTYTIYKITVSKKHKEADICDSSTCCQAWISKEDRLNKWKKEEATDNWNKIIKAVNETKGKIITYNGKPINAFFHSNSGGKTEIPFYVWGGEGYPYLQVVETAGEEDYSQYKSEVVISKDELKEKIKEKHEEFEIDYNDENCISIDERDTSNRVVTVKIGNLKLSGVEVRSILSLRSANFQISIDKDNIKFEVIRIWPWCRNEPNRCRCSCKTRKKLWRYNQTFLCWSKYNRYAIKFV
mgnify:FL=1